MMPPRRRSKGDSKGDYKAPPDDTGLCDSFQIEVAPTEHFESHALQNHDNEQEDIMTYPARMQKLWRIIGIWGVVDGCLGVILAVLSLIAGRVAIAGDKPCKSMDWILSAGILGSHFIKGSTAAGLLLRGSEGSHRGFLRQLTVITCFCCLCAALTAVEYYLGAKHLQAGGSCKDLGIVLVLFGALDTVQLFEEITVWGLLFSSYFAMRKESLPLASCKVAAVVYCPGAVKPVAYGTPHGPQKADSSKHPDSVTPSSSVSTRTTGQDTISSQDECTGTVGSLSEPSPLKDVASWPAPAVESPASTSALGLLSLGPAAGTPVDSCREQGKFPSKASPGQSSVEARMVLSHVYIRCAESSKDGRLVPTSDAVVTDNHSNTKSQPLSSSRGGEAATKTRPEEGGLSRECSDFRISFAEDLADLVAETPQDSIGRQCDFSKREARKLLLYVYAQCAEKESARDKADTSHRRKRRNVRRDQGRRSKKAD